MKKPPFSIKKSNIYRRRDFRSLRKLFFIGCCGQTETRYFQRIIRELRGKLHLKVKAIPKDPSTILKKVLKIPRIDEQDQKWLVIDKDNFKNIQYLISTAKRQGVQVAYSNPCFELWILLHYEYLETEISIQNCIKKLEHHIGRQKNLKRYKYEKNDTNLYNYIYANRSAAVRRAKKLMEYWQSKGELNPDRNNPSTNIFSLIELLFS